MTGPGKNSTRQYSKWGAEIMSRAHKAGIPNMSILADKAQESALQMDWHVSRSSVANALKIGSNGKEPNPCKNTMDAIVAAIVKAEEENAGE